MAPKTQQWYHDYSSNHKPNPQSGKPSWKHVPQILEKYQALDCRKNYKQASLSKYILSHPTHYHYRAYYLGKITIRI